MPLDLVMGILEGQFAINMKLNTRFNFVSSQGSVAIDHLLDLQATKQQLAKTAPNQSYYEDEMDRHLQSLPAFGAACLQFASASLTNQTFDPYFILSIIMTLWCQCHGLKCMLSWRVQKWCNKIQYGMLLQTRSVGTIHIRAHYVHTYADYERHNHEDWFGYLQSNSRRKFYTSIGCQFARKALHGQRVSLGYGQL